MYICIHIMYKNIHNMNKIGFNIRKVRDRNAFSQEYIANFMSL